MGKPRIPKALKDIATKIIATLGFKIFLLIFVVAGGLIILSQPHGSDAAPSVPIPLSRSQSSLSSGVSPSSEPTPALCRGSECKTAIVSLTYLLDQVRNGEVQKIVSDGFTLEVVLKDGTKEQARITPGKDLVTDYIVPLGIVINTNDKNKLDYSVNISQPTIFDSLLSILFILGLVVLGFWVFLKIIAKGNNPSGIDTKKLDDKSKNIPQNQPQDPKDLVKRRNEKVTFKDVGGAEDAIKNFKEIIEFLKNPARFVKYDAKMPQGVLLVGPPGTGKTLLAQAVAGEAGVPFFTMSGSDFVEIFVGVGAKRVRDVFSNAKKNSPCIIFIDEFDALGSKRESGPGGSNREDEKTIDALLSEMDGFSKNAGVIFIGATNRPDMLDQALLRPGRFDRQIIVDRPDFKARLQILWIHAKKKPIENKRMVLRKLAHNTPGLVGADLANILNEAAIHAAMRENNIGETIIQVDIDYALDRAIAGEAKKRLLTAKDKSVLAYHESGHAIVQFLIAEGEDVPERITIVSHGQALGYTYTPERETPVYTRRDLMNKVTGLVAGNVAEEILLKGEFTTGHADDFSRATEIAERMVNEFTMGKGLPRLVFKLLPNSFIRRHSQETQVKLDAAKAEIIEEARAEARRCIEDNYLGFQSFATELLEKETLSGNELFDAIVKHFSGSLAVKNAQERRNRPSAEEDITIEDETSNNGKVNA